jgi:hypothetical protein
MPLMKSGSKEAVGKNIKAEMKAGKPKETSRSDCPISTTGKRQRQPQV